MMKRKKRYVITLYCWLCTHQEKFPNQNDSVDYLIGNYSSVYVLTNIYDIIIVHPQKYDNNLTSAYCKITNLDIFTYILVKNYINIKTLYRNALGPRLIS